MFLPHYAATERVNGDYSLVYFQSQQRTITEFEEDEPTPNDVLFDFLRGSEISHIPEICRSIELWHKRTEAWQNHYLPQSN